MTDRSTIDPVLQDPDGRRPVDRGAPDHFAAVASRYRSLRITDHAVRGFALGTAAHGIGTARAFQESEEAGAFSGLAMGLCGLVTAVLFPFGVWLVRALQ